MRMRWWFSFLVLSLGANFGYAQSATWNANPVDGNWNNPANWTPRIIPTTAIFGVSSQTDVFVSENTNVFDVQFSPGATSYTITASPGQYLLLVVNSGISNDSGVIQNFRTSVDSEGRFASFFFQDETTADVFTQFTNPGASKAGAMGGLLSFSFLPSQVVR